MASYDFSETVQKLRKSFSVGTTLSYEYRLSQLKALQKLVTDNEEKILDALWKDLGKPKREALIMEFSVVKGDLMEAIDDLHKWMGPEVVASDLLNKMDTCALYSDPYGTVLIIGAWNYPLTLNIQPLIGAIAAGCTVILKPSEIAPHFAALIEQLISQYLDKDCYRCICGGIPETTALLKERFDLVFYTGSTAVGKIVMKAAAEHLTPVVLELGGKSPCFIDDNSDLELVANRLSWGKFVNAGQTCLAPDYVLCSEKVQDKLVTCLKETLKQFYGDNPAESENFSRMVNERHFKRVQKLINEDKVVIGGDVDEDKISISPTVLANVDQDDAVMQEEIFGPILPIIPVKSMDDAIKFVNSREKPLTVYIFSRNENNVEKIINRTSSGTVCVNDTVVQAGVPTLPFGGVGHSGTGSYHGKFTFQCFTHRKGCLFKKQSMEALTSIRYPPYTDKKVKLITLLLVASRKNFKIYTWIRYAFMGVLMAIIFKAFGFDECLKRKYSEWI